VPYFDFMAKYKSPYETKWDEPALREVLVDQLAGYLRTDSAEVDPDKSFDEYGLDSIDAVIATELIGEKLGIELPPEFLLYHRSVNAIVGALLNNQLTDVPASAPQAEEALIFLFPGGGGRDEHSLVRFRDQCVPTLNFEVVSPGDWRDWIKHDLDFDKLATRACRHIEAIQAEGTVRLAGYSQGGQLAYASALTLSRAGRPVEFVGLLDSFIQSSSDFAPLEFGAIRRALRLVRYMGAVMLGRYIYHKDVRIRLVRALWQQCRGPVELRKLLMFAARIGVLFRGAGGVRLNNYIQMQLFAELSAAWFAQNCRSRPLDSPVFLFRSGDPDPPDLGWTGCCSDLTVIPIAGDHYTMFDADHLDDLVIRFVTAVRREHISKAPELARAPT
jgi:thioesterase domain-containing protein/acyl carrier protein